MKLISSKRRMAVVGLTVGLIAGASGLAVAYFTSSGSGNGSAQTGTASNVTITQVGAGYDSLIPSNSYIEDQCMQGCTGPSELGNEITLANTDSYQQLTTVVLAVRNWGPAITGAPITLNINNTADGPVSFTQDFNVQAAATVNSVPTTQNLTFNVVSQGIYVQRTFEYGFSFGDPTGDVTGPPADPSGEDSLNIALSSEATDLSVGTDTDSGTLGIADSNGNNNDFPSCMTFPISPFQQVNTECGSSQELGAYGTLAQVQAGNANIPAVEFNVVGGTAPDLYPGGPPQPVNFAITNPGSTGVTVGTVTTAVSSVTTGSIPGDEMCATSMYSIGDPTVGPIGNVNPGTTIFAATGTSISMTDDTRNQDNCEGAVVTLGFTTTP
jgi:hypothetical protein